MKLVFFAPTVSPWGARYSQATGDLARECARQGHEVLVLERAASGGDNSQSQERLQRVEVYQSGRDLRARFGKELRQADAVVVGSYLSEGEAIVDWVLDGTLGVKVFHDVATPVTWAALEASSCTFIRARQIGEFDVYLSSSQGPVLAALGERFGARLVVPFFMAIDPQVHRPELCEKKWALNFLGTYSPGRQATVEALLNEPARELAERSFAVAGGRYPDRLRWPANVDRLDHLPPRAHRGFYCEGRFTLNVNRREIGRVGHTPSLRLFEAAACGVPVITDRFDGVEQLFTPGTEILVARSSEDVLRFIQEISDEECREIGERARARVLAEHTLETRAHTLMACIEHVRPGWVERAAQHATVHP